MLLLISTNAPSVQCKRSVIKSNLQGQFLALGCCIFYPKTAEHAHPRIVNEGA